MPGSFLDTNVLVYLASADPGKAARAEALLAQGGTISVQVLNEWATVARRKLDFSWDEVSLFLETLRALLRVVPLDEAVHELGLRIARRYGLSVYDAMIAGAALEAGCDVLWSEDMHHGLVIDGVLEVRNPFA
jgi:predicted nucleic acid-binding protein